MIQAKIVADSLAPNGARLTTLEIVFPRYILAELNTHRLFSKNSASSRAIPFEKMVKQVITNPFIPYAWQVDHKGMQGTKYLTETEDTESAKGEWIRARDIAVQQASYLNNIGVTKQLCNRLLEPFMYHKVLISATEWENFFNLRCPKYTFHDEEKEYVFKSRKETIELLGTDNPVEYFDGNVSLGELSLLQWLGVNTGQADIHMMFLAEAIYDAIQESEPVKLKEGEWHIPYGDNIDVNKVAEAVHKTSGNFSTTLDEAICKISIARCARLSYQTLGDNPIIDYEKDLALYENLSTSGHWSPFEHIAKAMTDNEYQAYGHTYLTPRVIGNSKEGTWRSKDEGWCRNFKGFIQYRELLD